MTLGSSRQKTGGLGGGGKERNYYLAGVIGHHDEVGLLIQNEDGKHIWY